MNFLKLMSEKNDINFSKEQIKALKHLSGPALILAGPGSGKTTVITARTSYLILEKGIKPEKVLTLTFNKAAQKDMEQRFTKLFKDVARRATFSTLHSFCNQIVRDYERSKGKKLILIEEDKQAIKRGLIKKIYADFNGTFINDDELEKLINEISLVKNMMSKDNNISIESKNFEEIFNTYDKIKKQNYYMDFDDMLTYAYHILRKCPDILNKYRTKYEYIQVDEGQDLSKIQFEIIKLLSNKKEVNLYIVADDDQSIYGFRGAMPQQLIDIKKEFDNVKIYRLENNYRSSKNIVDISSQFIKANKNRYDKNHKNIKKQNKNPFCIQVNDEKEQISFIIKKIKEHKSSGKTTGILYRNNISSILLANALEKNKISFKIKQSKIVFLKHWLVQDIIAFLNFSYNQTDIDSFMKIYYKMNRYISKEIIEKSITLGYKDSVIDGMLKIRELKSYQINRFKDLKQEFYSLSKKDPFLAFEYIENNFNYLDWLKDYCKNSGLSYEYLYKIYSIIKTIAEDIATIPLFINRLSELDILVRKGKLIDNQQSVNLTTMHSSKGLEYDTVFLMDLYNNEIPGQHLIESKKENEEILIEEERRLFYVAMTRAKENLYIITLDQVNQKIEKKSIFVDEVLDIIDKYIINSIGEGSIIYHKKFGEGIISELMNNKSAQIIFKEKKRKLNLLTCIRNDLISIK